MFKLIIEDDEGKTTVVPITRDEITIGRKEGNNIRLTERNVSRHHARISRQNGSVSIEDLDSYNGIRVNGDRIQVKSPVAVNEGDLIEIGDYHLAIQLEGSDSPGLAGASGGDEATQRVSVPMAPNDEVTSQVAMGAQHHHAAIHADTPPLGGDATQRDPLGMMAASAAETTAQVRVDPPGAPPNHFEPTLDQDGPPGRRVEPTAIIRHADLAREAPPAQADVARLVVMSTVLAGQSFPLTQAEMIIGRTDDNDIQIDHRSVSRNHAKIVKDGNRYSVVDLKSANGVLVNGEEYARMDLRKGDVIELGHVKLRFVEPGENFALSKEQIAELSKDDGDAEEFGGDTTNVTAKRGAKKAGGGGIPVKLVAVGVAVLLLAGIGIGVAVGGGGGKQPKDPEENGKQVAVAAKDPEPAAKDPEPETEERKKPARRDPEPEPEPERVDTSKTVRAAQAALRAGEFSKAENLFKEAVEAGDPDGAGKKGLEQVAREEDANRQLQEALDLKDSDGAAAYRALNGVPSGTRARDKAVAEMKALRPKLVSKLVKDGEKALDDGDAQAAKDLAEEALAIDEKSRDATRLADKADKAIKAKNSQKAAAERKNAQAAASRAADARKALDDGNRAILLGDFQEAVNKGKLALKLDASLSEAHKLLGVAFARQSKYCDAKYHYKKFIELNPSSPMVDRIKQILQGPELQNCQ